MLTSCLFKNVLKCFWLHLTTIQCNTESIYPIHKAEGYTPYTILFHGSTEKNSILPVQNDECRKSQAVNTRFYVMAKIFIPFRVSLDLIRSNANLMLRSHIWSCLKGLQGRRGVEGIALFFDIKMPKDGRRTQRRCIKRGFATLLKFTSVEIHGSFNGLGNVRK